MCLILILMIFSARLGAVFWWLVQPNRWESAFESWVWPVLGIVFLPWTTIMWVAVAPFGNVAGADWLWLMLGLFADFASYASSGYGGRQRYSSSSSTY